MDLSNIDEINFQERRSKARLTDNPNELDNLRNNWIENKNKRIFRTMDCTKYLNKCFKLRDALLREFLSEILCTFLMICFGCGSVAQYVLGAKDNFNSYLSINLSWATAVTMGILVCGKVSGAQMNPAVSLAMLVTGRLSIIQFFIYVVGQSIGALLGSVIVYLVYLDALNNLDGGIRMISGSNATAGIWATYPSSHLTTFGAIMDQLVGTTLLIIVILAVSDPKNAKISHGVKAFLIGNTVLMIGLSYGMNCGYGINPVRDFIPRLFTAISGWGIHVFTVGNYFFWIPLIIPFLGALVATFIYSVFISNHWPNEDASSNKEII